MSKFTVYFAILVLFGMSAWSDPSAEAQLTIRGDEARTSDVALVHGTRPLPPLLQGTFAICVIPDTQHYVGKGCKLTPDSEEAVLNDHLEAQVRWITNNVQRERIVLVTHVKDIVERDRTEGWGVAKQALDQLRDRVPFSLTVGNHDMSPKDDAPGFQSVFPATSFRDDPWCLQCYKHDRPDQNVSAKNVNSAQLFAADGVEVLHLSLECNAPDDVLQWPNGLLRQHSGRLAIITTHMDLGIIHKPTIPDAFIHDPSGRMQWVKIHGKRGNTGRQIGGKLYRHHANLIMVLSGDQSRVTALHLVSQAQDGYVVHGLLSDYISVPVLRLMRFTRSADRNEILSYDVRQHVCVERTLYATDSWQHRFTMTVNQSKRLGSLT